MVAIKCNSLDAFKTLNSRSEGVHSFYSTLFLPAILSILVREWPLLWKNISYFLMLNQAVLLNSLALRCYCLQCKQHVLSDSEYLADYTEVPSDSHNRCKSFEFFGPFFSFSYFKLERHWAAKYPPDFTKPIKRFFDFKPFDCSKLQAVHGTLEHIMWCSMKLRSYELQNHCGSLMLQLKQQTDWFLE